jgi:hypothetical protein
MRGEWFKLTAADVRAFKRWKRLYQRASAAGLSGRVSRATSAQRKSPADPLVLTAVLERS